ncbi:tryptophan synthase subunit beta [Massilibacterium senegalense]|uniref:tryptophan synthase subunit beta n=1 Tax=Massilibacterium senegalense TaxID=1632858 RepID=UPI000784C0AC|nr:tryptophan synthase subunit beta [Massilibacterium senegalense]
MGKETGRFGPYGGQFVPETLMHALSELEKGLEEAMNDPTFIALYEKEVHEYLGRPTPLYFAEHCSEALQGSNIYLKREDLNHTGSHKINNAIGQALLARRLGKKRVIAETGAGQHGVATATIAAKYGMGCIVFMGKEDMKRQKLNVFRMELLGATVVPAETGSQTLKDATNEAIRHWVSNVEDTYYIIGSVVGPHPYPTMVRNFQRIIGDEARAQFVQEKATLPDALVACVGGGSNSIGLFYPFLEDNIPMYGVEAAGLGVNTANHAATLTKGTKGVIHGAMTKLIQDENGQIIEPYSISAGLDYPGVGPEHAYLHEINRVHYETVTDKEALKACQYLSRTEGIIPALESSHALAYAFRLAKQMGSGKNIVVCLSGRGDKDVYTIMDAVKGGVLHV